MDTEDTETVSWQELAKAIPLFGGARLDGGRRVRSVYAEGHPLFRCGGILLEDGPLLRQEGGRWICEFPGGRTRPSKQPCIDLEDRMTANEVLCLLGEKVCRFTIHAAPYFYGDADGWQLRDTNGVYHNFAFTGITDRPTAIATAWIEAHQ